MFKNKKKFAITTLIATAASAVLAFEIDYNANRIKTLQRDSDRYKRLYESHRNLTKQMHRDFDKVSNTETQENVLSYWSIRI